jgi:hypothetical protein
MSVAWPAIPYEGWKDTCATLHRWTQIVGKVRLARSPWVNHSWHATFYVTSRGLTTSPIPFGERTADIDFDFIDHLLHIRASDGSEKSVSLEPKTVADFYREALRSLADLGFEVRIDRRPNEIEEGTPFDEDQKHRAYDPDSAHGFWLSLVQADRMFKKFRSRFLGKVSPVHFFWGSFDLAVTRFSGRRAPVHPGGVPNLPDWVTREAYSHEVSSCGFWPGNDKFPRPAFYAYAYPEPDGFGKQGVKPEGAFYSEDWREFFLPYDAVREAPDPDATLLDFLETTYAAAANRGDWDRDALEVKEPWPPRAQG